MKKYIIIILSMLVLFNIGYGQIIYNKSKPASYGKQELTKINDLPTIKFTVDENGDLSKDNLNINIKKNAINEKYDNINIARLKISLDVLSFGNITLRFNNIKLNNGSHCYVYTNDYQIVAGPIYSGAIDNYLNIVQIPAQEMIIEVVFNKRTDFDITLNTVSYHTVSKAKHFKKQEKLQAVGDYVCPCETHNISHYNIIDSTDWLPDKNQWLGYYANNQLFSLSKLSSVNDYDLDATRAACIIMVPNDNNSYYSKTGTLMNFPYDYCHSGFVFAAEHQAEIRKIISCTQELNNGGGTTYEDTLSWTLIRFNWHHKYGTPLHLENIPCNATNFALWRQTIDFSEVIDYCGVRAFAYCNSYYGPDMAIIKMLNPTFYKEQHLGWTTQSYFDVTRGEATYKEHFLIMGRIAYTPTSIFNNYKVEISNNPPPFLSFDFFLSNVLDNYPFEDENGNTSFDNISGISGSQILYPDYSDTTQRIGIGLIDGVGGSSSEARAGGYNYNMFFLSNYNIKYNFIDNPLYMVSDSLMYDYYLTQFEDDLLIHNYSVIVKNIDGFETIYDDSCYYMPSLENKEKCPSEVGLADTCKFNLSGYLSINGLCMTIASIPENLFPDGDYPKGYRVYHNFADQKTLDFETFHSGNDITFPLEFCIDSCDLFYFLNKGMDTLDIAIDFYDEFGKIFNNIGCDTASFKFPINMNFCDFIDFSISDSCCENKVTLKIDGCDNASHWVKTMLDSLSFTNNTTSETIKLNDIEGIYPDYLNGEITFDYPFEDNGNCSIISNFKGVACVSDEIEVKLEEE